MATYPPGLGTRHHAAKMNATKVKQARKSFATGKWSVAALARKYGISGPSMRAILDGRNWKHVS